MRNAQKTTESICRLERRRDSIKKRLAGVDRFDKIRHKDLEAIVDAVQKRLGTSLSDEDLIKKVKEELDKRAKPPGVWEAISDFGINAFVDIAVFYVRNRKKLLEQRLARVEARLERRRGKLRDMMEAEDESVSFSVGGDTSSPVFSLVAGMEGDDEDEGDEDDEEDEDESAS